MLNAQWERFVMNTFGALRDWRVTRRVSLVASAMLMSFMAAACSNHRTQTSEVSGSVLPRPSSTGVLSAPSVKAVQLKVAGESVKPISGITISLGENTVGLSPELLSDNHFAVTYVWPDERNWGYLAVEGPKAFDSTPDNAVQAAIAADRDVLAKQGVVANVHDSIPWEGFSHCGQLAWNQVSIPPGWDEKTSVDVLSLYVIDGQKRTVILTAYVPPDGFNEGNPAFTSLCSLAVS